MRIEKVSYHKTFNLGNYSNEKIGIDIIITEGESPLDAFAEAKKQVEKSHLFFKQLPVYENAKSIVKNTDRYTGFQVKEANETIQIFEANFPDYIAKFTDIPFSRQLNESNDDGLKF